MIGRLHGILLEKQMPTLLLDVAGVGYEIQAPMSTFYKLPEIGQELTLHTHLAIREDHHALYGFFSKQEKHLFRELIKVNGIGPKSALGILSGISPEEFANCIVTNDINALVNLPGIGRKTAERLLIEMRGYVSNMTVLGDTRTQDAVNALISLGYKLQDAQKAINAHKNEHATCEELIRLALRDFNKH
jgi:holliday junction DNA helicase RuvA